VIIFGTRAIDGLKLTLTGEEIRNVIEQRAAEHQRLAAHWNGEAARTLEDQTEERPLFPQHMCENEAERHEWRTEFLRFLRDHVDPCEVYRLGECDLEFAELLPAPPAGLEQDDYEQRTREQLDLGPFARRICDSPEIVQVINPDWTPDGNKKGA
jgi:hypothetical protein